jgi:zinc transport system substrate-binding protein
MSFGYAWVARLLGIAALAAFAAKADAAPEVLVSIKPIHSIVASVMEGAGEPQLLLQGAASPHSYALKPSDARAIAHAEVIFWVGPELENFLAGPLAKLAPRARRVALAGSPGLIRLPARNGGVWEHDADEPASLGIDGHIWLDPNNGAAIARIAARVLGEADPAHAGAYSANAEAYAARLTALDQGLAIELKPMRGRPYILFHDAYQYFEAHFGLTPLGAVTVASERPPGVRRIEELRARIKSSGAICVLSTPQFTPRLVTALTEGTRARTAAIDDLGAGIPMGPSLYETLLTRIADSFGSCLKE